jgi:uncharacterized peroxidase-related enzyme
LTKDPVLAERVAFDYRRAELEPRTRAMLDYAIKITRQSVECTEADIEALRAHGYSDEDISDIINTAAIYNFTVSPTPAAISPTGRTIRISVE